MKIKVSETTNIQLDWLVAKVLGLEVWAGTTVDQTRYTETVVPAAVYLCDDGEVYSPSINWSQGGPIIKRECITLQSPTDQLTMFWVASSGQNQHRQFNHDPLIAAMRCFVTSSLGDEVEVEVPDDLGETT